jgi:hypothetical protein
LKYWIFLIILFAGACASIQAPEGGEVDIAPPVLIKERSTPNEQLRYRPEVITLEFDEWIELKDPAQEVVISPPTRTPPKIVRKGKTVEVSFDPDEPWKDSTTYILQFGKAIIDRNEGNIAHAINYVFSTGNRLDSLSANGTLLDAKTLLPIENALILLYRGDQDSIATNTLPDYYTSTDKNGHFQFKYMRPGNYRVFSLLDKNRNYRYDFGEERLGWLDQRVQISADSNVLPLLNLPLPVRVPRIIAIDSTSQNGQRTYHWNRPVADTVKVIFKDHPLQFRWIGDTSLRVFQQPGCPDGFLTVKNDTLIYPGFRDTLSAIAQVPKLTKKGKQEALAPLVLKSEIPLSVLDTALIQVMEDSLQVSPGEVQLLGNGDTIAISGITQPDANRAITFLPGALTSWQGAANEDTLKLLYLVGEEGALGSITIVLEEIPRGEQVILELINAKYEPERHPVLYRGLDTWAYTFSGLEPGSYKVFISLDQNGNGRWDSGDYYAKQPSEPRSLHEVPPLRANWEVKITLIPEWVKPK